MEYRFSMFSCIVSASEAARWCATPESVWDSQEVFQGSAFWELKLTGMSLAKYPLQQMRIFSLSTLPVC